MAAINQVGAESPNGGWGSGGGYALEFAGKELMYDMEIIFTSFESNPKALKWLHIHDKFEINETIIRELRKKYGEKEIKKHLSVDKSDLRYDSYNSKELRKMMKR